MTSTPLDIETLTRILLWVRALLFEYGTAQSEDETRTWEAARTHYIAMPWQQISEAQLRVAEQWLLQAATANGAADGTLEALIITVSAAGPMPIFDMSLPEPESPEHTYQLALAGLRDVLKPAMLRPPSFAAREA